MNPTPTPTLSPYQPRTMPRRRAMFRILSAALAAWMWPITVAAADWHVAPTGGDDQAGTEAAPFATISKAAAMATPGDTVWIAPGVYRETVRPANSGTAAAPIVFRGRGGRPQINGADVVAGPWTQVGSSGVYWAEWVGDFTSIVAQSDQVFVDGEMIDLLRWPKDANQNLTRPTLAEIDGVSFEGSNSRVTDAAWDQPDGRWTGARVWVNLSNEWDGQGQSGAIQSTDLAAKQIVWFGIDTRGGNGAWGVRGGTEYYLFDPTPAGLAATGGVEAALGENEWWLDRSARRLYVRLAGNADPTGRVVEARRRDWAFNLVDRSHITLHGLDFFAASLTTDPAPRRLGLPPTMPLANLATSTDVTLDDLRVDYVTHFYDQTGDYQTQWAGQSGLVLNGSRHIVRNSVFRWSAGSALSLTGFDHRVYNNLFEDIGYMVTEAGVINTGKGDVPSRDFKIGYNTIRDSAGLGISIRMLRNSDPTRVGLARVHHNHIYDVMQRVHDAAAIDWVGVDSQWVRIDHNVIHGLPEFLHFGIYPDYGAGGGDGRMRYQIDHNVVFDVWGPIAGNGYRALRINNNVAIGSRDPANGGTRSGIFTSNGVRDAIDVEIYNNITTGSLSTLVNAAQAANLTGSAAALAPLFVDATNTDPLQRDFTPRADALTVIDQGVVVPPWDDPIVGTAPDIGAFEHGRPAWTAGYEAVPWFLDDFDTLRITAAGATRTGRVRLHAFGAREALTSLSVATTSAGVTVELGATSLEPDGVMSVAVALAANVPAGTGWFEIEGQTATGAPHRQVFTFEVLPPQTITDIVIEGASSTAWELRPAASTTLQAVALDASGLPLVEQPSLTWGVTGGGSVDAEGQLTTAPRQGGPYAVTVTADGVTRTQLFTLTIDWARVGTMSASSELPTNPKENAVDDSTLTGWFSNSSDPQWLRWDLGEPVSIEFVRLLWSGSFYARDYAVEVSPDGTTWQRVLSVTGNSSGGEKIHAGLEAPASRYVRVLGLTRNSTTGRYGLLDVNLRGRRASDGVEAGVTVTTAGAGGTVARTPDKPLYGTDERVILRAVADDAYAFVRWEGDATGTTNPITLATDRNLAVTAVFEPVAFPYTLTINATNGMVTRSPEREAYAPNESVTLTASPTSGHGFAGWSGDASGTTPQITVVMDRSRTITATFAPLYSLNVISVEGTVTRMPDQPSYLAGESITLTATPASGYRFFRWTGAASGTAPSTTVALTGNSSVTAEYLPIVELPPDSRLPGGAAAVRVTQPITIDGRPDESWALAPRLPIALPVDGTDADELAGPEDLSATWSASWDDQALYLLIVVTDDRVGRYGGEWDNAPTWWTDDAIEIYLDPDMSGGTSYDRVNDLQIGLRPLDPANTVFFGANSVTGLMGIRSFTTLTATGYVMEVALPWSSLGVNPTDRAAIGIEVAVNDGDVNGGTWPPARLGWVNAGSDSAGNPSAFGILPLLPGGESGRLMNLSVRSEVGRDEDILIAGFVWHGEGGQMLARGVGPTLREWEVQGVLEDPQITLLAGPAIVAENDSWSARRAELDAAAVAAGAFPLMDDREGGLLHAMTAGAYTLHVRGANGTTGVGLAELYAVDGDSAVSLLNLSGRAWVGAGERVLIGGLVVGGGDPVRVLVRAVGPGLTAHGVTRPLTDPVIELYDANQQLVASNDDWASGSDAVGLRAAMAGAGAFALAEDSADAALLLTLAPGGYTAVVRGKDEAAGVALVEIYRLP